MDYLVTVSGGRRGGKSSLERSINKMKKSSKVYLRVCLTTLKVRLQVLTLCVGAAHA
jgi:hypothetical protein